MPLPEEESEAEQGGRLDDQQYENEVRAQQQTHLMGIPRSLIVFTVPDSYLLPTKIGKA